MVKKRLFRRYDLPFRFNDGGLSAPDVGFRHVQLLDRFVEILLRVDFRHEQAGYSLVVLTRQIFHGLGARFVHAYPLCRGLGRRESGRCDLNLHPQLAIVEPRQLLLIDEPSKGLAPAIIQNMIEAFRQLKAAQTTILLVEQNFNFARQLGDSVAVMDDGRVVHSGSMAELAADESLQSKLLGLSLGAHQ